MKLLSLGAPDHFEIIEGRAVYRPAGTVSLGEAVEMVSNAIVCARMKRVPTLLVNMCALNGFGPPSVVERYFFSEKWAAAASRRVRLAVVAPAEMIHPNKFGVAVAANRGLVANTFVSEADAKAWLESSCGSGQDAAMAGHDRCRGLHTLLFAEGRASVWITRSQGAACDACGRTIPVHSSQYELVMESGREIRFDQTCLQRHVQELDG